MKLFRQKVLFSDATWREFCVYASNKLLEAQADASLPQHAQELIPGLLLDLHPEILTKRNREAVCKRYVLWVFEHRILKLEAKRTPIRWSLTWKNFHWTWKEWLGTITQCAVVVAWPQVTGYSVVWCVVFLLAMQWIIGKVLARTAYGPSVPKGSLRGRDIVAEAAEYFPNAMRGRHASSA